MFQDWKEAWRQAVENFRREIGEDGPGDASPTARAMVRELTSAREAFSRIEAEILRTKRDAEAERESEAVCRRREAQARRIADEETIRIAVEYAERHAERAVVFERKIGVLVEERDLLRRDLDSMEKIAAEHMPSASETPDQLEQREKQERDFSRLEREAREKAAADRLEELKRKMR